MKGAGATPHPLPTFIVADWPKMGNCGMSAEEAEQLRKSESIEKEMAEAYFEEMEKIKLLLLGEFSLRCGRARSYRFACSSSCVLASA